MVINNVENTTLQDFFYQYSMENNNNRTILIDNLIIILCQLIGSSHKYYNIDSEQFIVLLEFS